MSRYIDRTFWGLTIGLVVLLLVNFAFEEWMRGIALQSLARGLVALGLLILWRTGLISFGHALFFGVGAYSAALLQREGVDDAFVLLIAGTLAGGILAYLLGFLLRKYRAIYFALLNLAFSMILYGVLAKLEFLGSTDGIGVSPPTFLGFTMLRHFDGTQADPELAATDPGLFLQSSWDCSVSSSQWSPTCGSTS